MDGQGKIFIFLLFFWGSKSPFGHPPQRLEEQGIDKTRSGRKRRAGRGIFNHEPHDHRRGRPRGRTGNCRAVGEIDTAQVCAREGARLWGGHQPCGTQPVGRDERGERGNIRARTPECRGARSRWPQATRRARRAARASQQYTGEEPASFPGCAGTVRGGRRLVQAST